MSTELRNHLREIIEIVFNRWTALRLAVEHGMGGQNGLQTAIEMIDYVTDCCISNTKIDEENIVDLLEDIMDEEFNTICEDNSIAEIATFLIKYFNMLKSGNIQQIQQELGSLPPCEKWIVQGRKINFVSKPEDESSSDEEDEEMVESTIESPNVKINDNSLPPSTSGSTMKVIEEEVDPGWTVVKTKKRK
ncbi:CLUMA_CG011144, isoform A [Clunio marinus]|uniref:Pre-rRNA-processing protein TSR2 homolog n=1 Tax=Clunio marinus TaxID=568069 RepID=A0A1J1IDY2_9DIPT|nr:CLUMA_CG011144, isoform A [Clunio marinus]